MSSERVSVSKKPRRLPKKGLFFRLVRFSGWLLTIPGLLLLAIAVIGFFIVLVRIGPLFVETILRLGHSQMAGFLFIGLLVNLLFFPLVGLVGIVMAGIGLVFRYVGTEPALSTPASMTDQAQAGQPHGPTQNSAG